MTTCNTCHAIINAEAADLHYEWHARMEDAIRDAIESQTGLA